MANTSSTEEIIYKITVDIDATNKALADFTATNNAAAKSINQLSEAKADDLEATKRQETAAKKTKEAIEAEAGSIAALRKANKELTEIRNTTTTSTEEGRAKISDLNKQLDENNSKIKANVDVLSKQKIGVGDYSGALDKLVPGLGATATGFGTMATQALAFIATPIGAVIAALGVVIGALTQYFKGSEEGQDKLAKAMAIGRVIMQSVIQVVEKLGEVLFKAIEFISSLALKVVTTLVPAVGAALDGAIKKGAQIADLQDKIESDENAFIVRRAEVNKKVAELREKAITQEGDAKRKTIQEAINLEKDLAKAETEHSQQKLKLIDLEIASSGKATEEQKKSRAQALAEVIAAQAQGFEATLRFNKELEKLNDEQKKKQAEALKTKAAQDDIDAAKRAVLRREQEDDHARKLAMIAELDVAKTGSANTSIQAAQKSLDAQVKANDQINKDEATKTKIAALESNARLSAASNTLGQSQALFAKDSIAYKATGIARATIDTYQAATLALRSLPPPFGAIAAAINVALGLVNVSKIAGVQFYEGGYTGKGNPRDESTAVGARSYTYHKDEYITPSRVLNTHEGRYHVGKLEQLRQSGNNSFSAVGFADGGYYSPETQLAAQVNNQIDINKQVALGFLDAMPRQVLVLQDFESVQASKNKIATAAQF